MSFPLFSIYEINYVPSEAAQLLLYGVVLHKTLAKITLPPLEYSILRHKRHTLHKVVLP